MPEHDTDIAGVLDDHLGAEFEQHDLDRTMATMSSDPYLFHVPTLTGGVGRDEVRRFYGEDFIPAWPEDTG
jgi:carboxymethylenebutenolidase